METVDILGVEYDFVRNADPVEYPIMDIRDAMGYAEVNGKRIIIGELIPEVGGAEDISEAVDETMRHEIIHGFVYESGLYFPSVEEEERIVTWIARMFPRLLRSFRQIGCSGDERKKQNVQKE